MLWNYIKSWSELRRNNFKSSCTRGIKNATSAYTAEELVTRRSEVSKQIIEDLNAKVEKYGIVISELNIINLNFSEAYNNAIEAKQIAEQEVKKAQQELEKTKVEAEKK